MLNLEYCLDIPGWMKPNELLWLSRLAEIHQQIVEVGSFLGRSTAALCATPGKVTAVDIWEAAFVEKMFRQHMQNMTKDGKVEIWKMTSLEAAGKFASNGKADMVFLDGAHDYESVKAEIHAWQQALRPDGLLCGHDYENHTYQTDDVERAVRESIPPERLGRLGGSSIWFQKTSKIHYDAPAL